MGTLFFQSFYQPQFALGIPASAVDGLLDEAAQYENPVSDIHPKLYLTVVAQPFVHIEYDRHVSFVQSDQTLILCM